MTKHVAENLRLRLSEVWKRHDRQIWTSALIQMVTVMGASVTMPFFSLYLRSVGVSSSVIGMVVMALSCFSALAVTALGTFSDRFGRKPVMLLSLATGVLAYMSISYLIQIRASHWIIASLFLTAAPVAHLVRSTTNASVSDLGPSTLKTEAFGFLYIGLNIGYSIGNAIGGNLASISFSLLFMLPALCYLIVMILTARLVGRGTKQTAISRHELANPLEISTTRPFIAFCVMNFLAHIMMGQFGMTLAIFTTEFVGISKAQLGYLYVINGVYIVLMQYPIVLLIKRMRLPTALALSMLIYSVGYLSVGFDQSFASLVASMVVITTGEIVFVPSSLSVVSHLSPPHLTGRYMGLFISLQVLGFAFGPLVGGLLLDSFTDRPMAIWGIVSVIGIAAMVSYIAFGRREKITQLLRHSEGPR